MERGQADWRNSEVSGPGMEEGPSGGMGRKEATRLAWRLASIFSGAARAPVQFLPVCAHIAEPGMACWERQPQRAEVRGTGRVAFHLRTSVSLCFGLCSAEMQLCCSALLRCCKALAPSVSVGTVHHPTSQGRCQFRPHAA